MKLMLVSVVEEQLEADEENGGEAESVWGYLGGGHVQRVWGECDQQSDKSYGKVCAKQNGTEHLQKAQAFPLISCLYFCLESRCWTPETWPQVQHPEGCLKFLHQKDEHEEACIRTTASA